MTPREICQAFANKHKVIFEDKGECGFGRPCVGFRDGNYIAHNPYRDGEYDAPIPEFADERLWPGISAPDHYHKHDCLVVLVGDSDYEKAIAQLAAWVSRLESIGEVEIATYETGATGMQALISGVFGKAIRFKAGKVEP